MTQAVGAKPLASRTAYTILNVVPVLRLGKAALPCRRRTHVRVTAFTDRGASGLDVKVVECKSSDMHRAGSRTCGKRLAVMQMTLFFGGCPGLAANFTSSMGNPAQ